jgi:hypothetical protein
MTAFVFDTKNDPIIGYTLGFTFGWRVAAPRAPIARVLPGGPRANQ